MEYGLDDRGCTSYAQYTVGHISDRLIPGVDTSVWKGARLARISRDGIGHQSIGVVPGIRRPPCTLPHSFAIDQFVQQNVFTDL
jgi:hypothetical protein